MSEKRIRVLSFNCWGLKYVSKHRDHRISAIAHTLSASDYDIVALQEIWVFADYEKVQQSVCDRLPYSKFFYSGALGAGLAIFSRFPILSTSVHSYSLSGAPLDVIAGDWFVGKAAGSVVILHPSIGQIQVFNTHLFAKGGEDGPEYNRAHRLVNAWEFAKLARQAAEVGRYVIALGDFNSIPTTLPMTIIRDYAALSDSWSITHPNETSVLAASSPPEAIAQFGVTADSPMNSYSAGKPLDPHARRFLGKRLDYVLYRQPHRPHAALGESHPILKAVECKVVMTDTVPNFDFSFSDHFGLDATLEIQVPGEILPSERYTPAGGIVNPLVQAPELSSASIATVIQALTTCYQFSRMRSRKELRIFGLSIFLIIAITIGSSWLPYGWINPILFVATIFLSWLATTMLYEGFLYGKWECNALMNVIEELEIYGKGLETYSDIRLNSDNYQH